MKRATRTLIFVVLSLVLLVAVPGGALAVQSRDTANFTVSVNSLSDSGDGVQPMQAAAPGTAQVGEQVTFTLRSSSAENLAGFQFALRYNDFGLDLYTLEISDELKSLGYDVISTGVVRGPDGLVSFAAVTCAVADCASTDYNQPRMSAEASGDIDLVDAHFIVREPGVYAFQVEAVQVVDRDGLSTQVHQAAQLRSLQLSSLDLTENGFINYSDAVAVLGEWARLAETGQCITPALAHYDLDGSGCIDVADAQMILAHWGEPVDGLTMPSLELPQTPSEITEIYTVNNTGDGEDANPGNGVCAAADGSCTLRAAIGEAIAHAGDDIINFNVRQPNGACPALVAIQPATTLHIDDPSGAGLTIDGYSQCNAVENSAAVAGNAVIKIELRGNQTAGVHGLYLHSGNILVKGLAIFNFNSQLLLRGSSSHHNTIQGNFIGTNAANTHVTSFAGANDGIDIELGSNNNLIGGTTPAARNLISGNDQDGLNIQGPDVTLNTVYGNYIGLRQNGETALRNQSDGIDLAGGTHHNTIGGLGPGQRNVMSGNGGDGIEISHGGTHQNDVLGNFIGLRAGGTGITRNQEKGVTFEDLVMQNRVYRNVIAGNGGFGVRFYTSDSNELYDNFIGVYPNSLGPTVVVPEPSTISFANLVVAGNGTLPADEVGLTGVFLMGGSKSNSIRTNMIANHPEYGIAVSVQKGYLDIGTCETYYNTFSRNFIFNNTLRGIRLFTGDGGCGGQIYSGNQGIAAPVISGAGTNFITGTACPNCVVEIFLSDKTQVNDPGNDNYGEGAFFLASGTANGAGIFNIPISTSPGQILTATATSTTGNTSEFARNVAVLTGTNLWLPLIVNP